ncbi:unnamed protein product, partial [Mesorhabditis belari]|uniref:Uncharacterized protein n=1 Tax=Mesorhabditis belari TaxID=2138241 RepID=A0AAF3FS51_9BILA
MHHLQHGLWKTNIALRRLRDASLECTLSIHSGVEPELLPSPTFPLDPYAFITSSTDFPIRPTYVFCWIVRVTPIRD